MFDLLCGGNCRQARIEGNTATTGRRRLPDDIGIDHGGGDILWLQAQDLSDLHSHGGPSTSDVHRAGDEVDRAIAVDMNRRGGGLPTLPTKAHSQATSLVGACERGIVMRMG